ncbi:MAG: hypothetical protein GZ091_14260, partial [Paludibacter sp.]|nr:hypothetical protein [Paludibacter sp.]
MPLSATPGSFDGDKPAASFSSVYSQSFNVWDGTKLANQWDYNGFDATNISNNSLNFTWGGSWTWSIILRSKSVYAAPYVFTTQFGYAYSRNSGGIVIRVSPSKDGEPNALQEPADSNDDYSFNRTGIAFYSNVARTAVVIQFTGSGTVSNTPFTRFEVPIPAGQPNLFASGGQRLRIEDFGTTIYTYYNDLPLARIDLGGLIGSQYTSGTVYNSTMQTLGTFSSREIELSGKVAVAQRVANLQLYNA